MSNSLKRYKDKRREIDHAVVEAKRRHAMRRQNDEIYRNHYNEYDISNTDFKSVYKHLDKFNDKTLSIDKVFALKEKKILIGKKTNIDRPNYKHPKSYKALDKLNTNGGE